MRCWAHLILSGLLTRFVSMAWRMASESMILGLFWFTWLSKFLQLSGNCSLINYLHFSYNKYFRLLPSSYGLVWTCKAKVLELDYFAHLSCSVFKSQWSNAQCVSTNCYNTTCHSLNCFGHAWQTYNKIFQNFRLVLVNKRNINSMISFGLKSLLRFFFGFTIIQNIKTFVPLRKRSGLSIMVILRNGIGDPCSNLGWGCGYFTLR